MPGGMERRQAAPGAYVREERIGKPAPLDVEVREAVKLKPLRLRGKDVTVELFKIQGINLLSAAGPLGTVTGGQINFEGSVLSCINFASIQYHASLYYSCSKLFRSDHQS